MVRSRPTGQAIRRRGLGFAPRSVHVGYMVDKVKLGQVSLRVLRFSSVSIFPPLLHIHRGAVSPPQQQHELCYFHEFHNVRTINYTRACGRTSNKRMSASTWQNCRQVVRIVPVSIATALWLCGVPKLNTPIQSYKADLCGKLRTRSMNQNGFATHKETPLLN
jgi:branched-subunit amino acid transport protein